MGLWKDTLGEEKNNKWFPIFMTYRALLRSLVQVSNLFYLINSVLFSGFG
jgi:hypothetical protein